jgi:tetratricopeptide (TPR) repeat protein
LIVLHALAIIAVSKPAVFVLSGGGALLVAVGVWWVFFGRAYLRRRAYLRAQQILHQGSWEEALAIARKQQGRGGPNSAWEGRLRNVEGECHRRAADTAIKEGRYEEALDHQQKAAELLNLNQADCTRRVVESMLDEARRKLAQNNTTDVEAAQAVLGRVLGLQPSCPEAFFWQAIGHLRQDHKDQAIATLRASYEGSQGTQAEPALYLGMLLRDEQPEEAVRLLAEANRLAPNSALVGWQLGVTMLAAGGDSQLAARALQKAVERMTAVRKGASGSHPSLTLAAPKENETPAQRLWMQGFAEGASFVRKLVQKTHFSCPLLGDNPAQMQRQAEMALGQAFYRAGNYQESSDVYQRILQESAPTAAILRGLGQALARLEKYEDAYKHLRAAYEQEEPAQPFTAGYLALCAALGKPIQAGDKLKNVTWALSLLAQFDLRGDPEWAELSTRIHSAARAMEVPIAGDDQLRLCQVLESVGATTPGAAAAYEHLAATHPDALRPAFAWLYCRAVQQHGAGGERELELFQRTFQDPTAARAYYTAYDWDFEDVEYTFLERWAARRPGSFPEVLGPAYAPLGERLLLNRSRRAEEGGRLEAAVAPALVLLRLSPRSLPAHDRLAALSYQRGDLERATALLSERYRLGPEDPTPLVRRAVVEQQRGNTSSFLQALEQALAQTHQARHGAIALLGTRLALATHLREAQHSLTGREGGQPLAASSPAGAESPWLGRAEGWLQECLAQEPHHTEALAYLAAVRVMRSAPTELAALAPAMQNRNGAGGRYHYLAACAQLAAKDWARAIEESRLAAAATADLSGGDAAYLEALALWHMQQPEQAAAALEKTLHGPACHSLEQGRGLLGLIEFRRGQYDEAIRWWQAVEPELRRRWSLEEPLKATVFLSGLLALETKDYAQAAARFREAGRIGLRDRQLGALLILALVEEGQRLLESSKEDSKEEATTAARLLEQALGAGCRDPKVLRLLALAQERLGKLREARDTLGKIAQPEAAIFVQKGLLALQSKQLTQAEEDFGRAWELDPSSYAAGHNLLLTRLTLGQIEPAAALVPLVVERAPTSEAKRVWQALHLLLRAHSTQNSGPDADLLLTELSEEDERQLVDLFRRLGNLEVALPLLQTLAVARPASVTLQDAAYEGALLQAKKLLDRCDWNGAENVLLVLTNKEHSSRAVEAAALNLLGCCACLGQDFESGAGYFADALRAADKDVRIQQNMALAHEWLGQIGKAEPHWNRYLDLLDSGITAPPGRTDYGTQLAFESYNRLATTYADKELWPSALAFAQKALELKPDDAEAAERLFHLYNQAGRPEEARRILSKLRQARPNDAQCDLFELDLIDARNLLGIDRLVTHIDVLVKKYPQDSKVEGRVTVLVNSLVPRLERIYEQLAEQLSRVTHRVRHLPNYQVDWSAVHSMSRDLRGEFQKLRRVNNKCLPLLKDEELRRALRTISDQIERKMDQCRSLGG